MGMGSTSCLIWTGVVDLIQQQKLIVGLNIINFFKSKQGFKLNFFCVSILDKRSISQFHCVILRTTHQQEGVPQGKRFGICEGADGVEGLAEDGARHKVLKEDDRLGGAHFGLWLDV